MYAWDLEKAARDPIREENHKCLTSLVQDTRAIPLDIRAIPKHCNPTNHPSNPPKQTQHTEKHNNNHLPLYTARSALLDTLKPDG